MNLMNVKPIDIMVGRVVTDQLSWFLNAGYTVVKVASGGINDATKVYFLVDLTSCESTMANRGVYPVTLLVSRWSERISQRVEGINLFEIQEHVVGYTTVSSEAANTSFLDSLYKKNEWNIIFKGFTEYGNDVVYPDVEALVNYKLGNC